MIEEDSDSEDDVTVGDSALTADPYAKLALVLRLATPGKLVFVEQNPIGDRRELPERLWRDGVSRPYLHVDFASHRLRVRTAESEGPREEPLLQLAETGALAVFLKALLDDQQSRDSRPIELLYIDGLESRIDSETEPVPGGELERLNLSREALSRLECALVFLMPSYVVQMLRTAALNLWTWRLHHATLAAQEEKGSLLLFTDRSAMETEIPSGDDPEARNRRIRVAQRMLDEEMERGVRVSGASEAVLSGLISDLKNAGRSGEALNLLNRVCEEEGDGMPLETQSNLGILRGRLLHQEGRYDEAQSVLEQTLRVMPESEELRELRIQLLHVLGSVLASRGNLLAAETYIRRAIATLSPREKEKNYPLMHAIGEILKKQGRYTESNLFLRRALRLAEVEAGPEHPYVSSIINSLSDVLDTEGRTSEAMKLTARAVAIDEKSFGPEHPEYAISLANLGWYHMLAGENVEAESKLRRAVEILQKKLGSEHSETNTRIRMLGDFLLQQQRYDEAEPMIRTALKTVERLLGAEHLDVSLFVLSMARLYIATGRKKQAEPLVRRALRIREKCLGKHPQNVVTMLYLANLLDDLGRKVEGTTIRMQASQLSRQNP